MLMIFGINIKILIMVKLFTLKAKNNYIQEQDQSSSRFVRDSGDSAQHNISEYGLFQSSLQ